MTKDASTVDEESQQARSVSAQRRETFVLCVAYCQAEPWRVGEVLAVSPETRGQHALWGRGASSEGGQQILLGQHRPGRWLPSPPLHAPAISRHQLSLQSVADARVRVRNLGKCPMFHNGVLVSEAELLPGDLLRLGKQLLFVCALRVQHGASDLTYSEFPFGRADAHGIVGESSAAWQLRQRAAFVAARSDHVLIHGPSGAGKELAARAVHELSSRSTRPLVSRNAATLPELLIDAELFGNAKNYPNPGMPERLGLVGEAHGSSLFLDEIAELPEASQTHLLRVLDKGEYQRLGESRIKVADFRLIAATNRDPTSLKHDLLARFTLRLSLPDLSKRWEDVPLLVRHLLQREAERGDALALRLFPQADLAGEPDLPLELINNLLEKRPLNVRELRTQLWELLAAQELGTWHQAGEPQPGEHAASGEPEADGAGLDAARIQRCLDENNGVIEQTWRALGLSNRYVLMRLIRKHDLELRKRAAGLRTK
jgi:DNA-binding NtrC family response regulator